MAYESKSHHPSSVSSVNFPGEPGLLRSHGLGLFFHPLQKRTSGNTGHKFSCHQTNSGIITIIVIIRGAKYCDEYVCLFFCPLASYTAKFHQICCAR